MRNQTRVAFSAYAQQIATLNGVENAAATFSVDPSVQQTLETKLQETSAFLSKINIHPVDEQEGEKIGLGISGPIASRTNTDTNPRVPRPAHSLDGDRYRCEKTNYDTYLKYAQLDAWAKFPDFQVRVRDAIVKRHALDRIMVGWNGTSVAATTNPTTNPLLQDVNIGWLQKYRTNASERVMDEGVTGSGKVKVGGAGADYANLDAVVYDALQLLDPWWQDDTALVVMLGRGLLHDKYFPMVNQDNKPTEVLASDIVISQKRVGGLAAATVPYFPANALMVTRFDNLSIYFQAGARRRMLKDNPERDRIDNFESSNDAFVVEDYGLGCVVENIELPA
ncbi:phage major capsid protein, P2 family [Pigmentiphaga sp. CHJ604]|uniref:phage major capsid protein, P2 family n=1 Tax=Pigmentiphaga sp. CHJ604 TaxID=3081984 RepID=UPI0030D23600